MSLLLIVISVFVFALILLVFLAFRADTIKQHLGAAIL